MTNQKDNGKSDIQGFFPFGFAWEQNDGGLLIT